ncbi:unnamed protein product [Ambrosiozyma monospora]|uniref:Unnamed protein product n=1 Tax=Ambrosiozyma monospora TaxID=43982 RepID=A0ACB5T2A9_AMBMO|nr:unnamed protein product [Ambrosiozyma monospora]
MGALKNLGKLREVQILGVGPILDLSPMKPLLQSSSIKKIDLFSKYEYAFIITKDSESTLKKFENKLKLHADYVNGLLTLRFVQKTCDPTILILESFTSLSDIQVKHVVVTFPLRNNTPRNDKINFLDITGGSYSGTTFDGLTSLKGLSVGLQQSISPGRVLTERKKNIIIDWRTIQTLPVSIKALNLCGAVIKFPSAKATKEMGKFQLPKSIEYLQCTSEQLTLFSIESTTTVRCLTLAISDLITESDVCWQYLPANVSQLYLVGEIPQKSISDYQLKSRPANHPQKLGGMTIPKRLKSHISLSFNGLKIVCEDSEEPSPLSISMRLSYYTLNYDEENRYIFSEDDLLRGWELFFNIDVSSESVVLDIECTRGGYFISESQKYNFKENVNGKFFLKPDTRGFPYHQPWPEY